MTQANELAGEWTREYVDEDKSLRIVEVESGGNGKMKIILNPNYEVLLDNEDIAKAEAKPVVGDEAHFAVHLVLTAQAAERFARETKRIAERGGVPGRPYSKADGATRRVARQPDPTLRLAILLDGKPLRAPRPDRADHRRQGHDHRQLYARASRRTGHGGPAGAFIEKVYDGSALSHVLQALASGQASKVEIAEPAVYSTN